MTDIFTNLKRLSFGGIEFPFTEIQVKGALRHHLHEFIKRPGGEVETLARRAYSIVVRCDMLDTILPLAPFAQWVDVYPSKLAALVSLCEQGQAQDLWIPNWGRSLRVKATDWTRTIMAAKRSGEAAEFTFLEDSTATFTSLNMIGASAASLVPKLADLQVEIEALNDPPALSAFDRLEAALDAYITAKDDALAAAEYQTARIDAVVARCSDLASVPSLGLSTSAVANTALLSFWAVTIQVRNHQIGGSRPLLARRAPRPNMSVVDLSLEVFGDTTHAVEILRMNDFDDAMSIPFATPFNYLAPLPGPQIPMPGMPVLSL